MPDSQLTPSAEIVWPRLIGDFTPQELALAGFQFQTCLCHPLQELLQVLRVFVERLGVDKEVVEVDK